MRLSWHVQTPSQTIIVAAIASRPYIDAAVLAGYDVVSIDCFSDVDTQHLALASYQVDIQNGQLNGEQLLNILADLNLPRLVGFCYGAGFEQQPELIETIASNMKVFGNAASVVAKCTNPYQLFAHCDVLNILYPRIRQAMPQQADGWLRKLVGGSGGAHIQALSSNSVISGDVYYQKYVSGQAVSCLFLANQGDIQVIGFNALWQDATDTMRPFRYGGAVSHVVLDREIEGQFVENVKRLSAQLKLTGLNSCDAVVDDANVFVLEVNPRLSATLDLYPQAKGAVMAAHIKAGRALLPDSSTSFAHQVIYANKDTLIEAGGIWPSWVKDIPRDGECVSKGMPICTVAAEADSPDAAKTLVMTRAAELAQQLSLVA